MQKQHSICLQGLLTIPKDPFKYIFFEISFLIFYDSY